MNPCPCGYLGSPQHRCRCTPDQVTRYQGKLSGPFLDRIDLHVEVPAITTGELLHAPFGETSASIRERCTAARTVAFERQGKPNAALQGREIDQVGQLDAKAAQFLNVAAARLGWSARGVHRTLRVARTIADLVLSTRTQTEHVAEAMQYRHSAMPNGSV